MFLGLCDGEREVGDEEGAFMIMKMYSVFDSKLAVFGRPWFSQRDAAAIREFSDAVNDGSNPNNQWFRHPEDFSLFSIGEFDDENAELIPQNPVNLVTASALKQLDVFKELPVLNDVKEKAPVN